MKHKIISILVIISITLLLPGCGIMDRTAGKYSMPGESVKDSGRWDSGEEQRATSKMEISKQETEQIQNRKQRIDDNDKEEDEKKIYFGSLRLQVGKVEDARNTISALAEKYGGYVESMYNTSIVIRVKKEFFTEAFNEIKDLGDVLNKSIETFDVSEFFQDLNVRLDLAGNTRERLYELLKRTTDVEERLKITKEIRRLTEEIERIKLSLESLKQLITFSRISVELVPRLSEASYIDQGAIPFYWISQLNSLYSTLRKLDIKVKFSVSEDFAVFDKDKYFHAESPDGVRVRIGSTKNEPEGDAEFWQKALQYHLKKFYKSTELITPGKMKGVLFISKDARPFFYMVNVITKGDKIVVAEIFFPDKAGYDEKKSDILKRLAELEVKG